MLSIVGRRCLILGLVLAGLPYQHTSLYGQNLAIGLKGGTTLSDVSSSQFEFGRAGQRTAFSGGVFLALTGLNKVSVQPELLYSQKGISILGEGGSAIAALDYISLPLLVKVSLSEDSNKIRPSVFAGSFLAFEINCSLSGDISTLNADDGCQALLERRGKMDAGFVIGAAVDIGLADRFFLTFDGRYDRGLLNLRWEGEGDRLQSRAWSFMGGVGVLLGR